MTRIYHFGEPGARFREVYEIVLESNLAGEEAARAGNRLQDVDIAARNVIEKAGYCFLCPPFGGHFSFSGRLYTGPVLRRPVFSP